MDHRVKPGDDVESALLYHCAVAPLSHRVVPRTPGPISGRLLQERTASTRPLTLPAIINAAAYGSRIGARVARLSGTTKSIRFEFRTSDTRRHSRGGRRPRFACRCPSEEGAGNAGCALHPRSRVQICAKKAHTSIQGSGGNPTFPAQWLYGLYRAHPGVSGFLASVASRKLARQPGRAFRTSARLDANH